MREQIHLPVLLILVLVLSACSSLPPIRLYGGGPRPAQEIAVLSLPEPLEVARINGAPVKGLSGMLRGGDRVVELAPGRYELLIFYREIWDQTGNHEVLRSDPALFVLEARAGRRYVVDFERPRRYEQAVKLAQSFSGWIQDSVSGVRNASQASGMQFAGGMLGSLTGSLALEPVVTQTATPSQQYVAPLADPSPVSPDSVNATAVAGAQDAGRLEQMQAWWRQSSPEERREFLGWLAQPKP